MLLPRSRPRNQATYSNMIWQRLTAPFPLAFCFISVPNLCLPSSPLPATNKQTNPLDCHLIFISTVCFLGLRQLAPSVVGSVQLPSALHLPLVSWELTWATFGFPRGVQPSVTVGGFEVWTCIMDTWCLHGILHLGHPSIVQILGNIEQNPGNTWETPEDEQHFLRCSSNQRTQNLKGTLRFCGPNTLMLQISSERWNNLSKITGPVCRGTRPRNQVSWRPVEGQHPVNKPVNTPINKQYTRPPPLCPTPGN